MGDEFVPSKQPKGRRVWVMVPAEKIAALREAVADYRAVVKDQYLIGERVIAMEKVGLYAEAVVDAVETEAAPDELTALPTTPGSVIKAKPPGRKRAFLMVLRTDRWWQRLDIPVEEDPPFREVRVLFDAGRVR